MNRRTFVKGALASTIVAAGIGYHGIHTHTIEQTFIPVSLGLNKPLRIAALGDFHFDPLYEEPYLACVTDQVNQLQADLVLYTGDFVTHSPKRMGYLARLLSQCHARLGSFAVLGNHDHWSSENSVKYSLEKQGIRVLVNESFALPGEDNVYLTGLDSFWAGHPDIKILGRTPESSRHILLVHEPDSFACLDDPRIKLQISGHTHGGQVRAPLVGALILPKWGRAYDAGLYAQSGRLLYVNRGVGTLFPHVRFNCHPEITVFEVT